jgi:hypothetical protein
MLQRRGPIVHASTVTLIGPRFSAGDPSFGAGGAADVKGEKNAKAAMTVAAIVPRMVDPPGRLSWIWEALAVPNTLNGREPPKNSHNRSGFFDRWL